MDSDNVIGADNQQERPQETAESSEAICRTRIPGFVKIWSDLHGDMQSQAEQKRPGPRSNRSAVTKVSVPILRGRRKLDGSCP